MQFKQFSIYLEKLEKTASRLEMTRVLAELFKKCSGEEIDKVCYLALGRLAPKYEGTEFNMGEKLIVRAVGIVTGRSVEETTRVYKETGDLGETALKLKIKNKNSKISVNEVYDRLREIAEDAGKVRLIKWLSCCQN